MGDAASTHSTLSGLINTVVTLFSLSRASFTTEASGRSEKAGLTARAKDDPLVGTYTHVTYFSPSVEELVARSRDSGGEVPEKER